MSYQVLARKFRPGRFDEVIGQEPIVRTLRNALEGNRLAHAYLFSGVRGVGKTTLARILAKCLNCRASEAPVVDPCGKCESCLEISESGSLDVHEIDGASNRGIDDVRELRETSRYQPSRDRYRVFIIDEVHMLTREAFNALLKTLEEPPAHVVFLFATTEYQKVPDTIISRCQHFEFRRIPRPMLAQTLSSVAQREKVKLGDRAADLLARSAGGSMRDALGFLDQAIAYCGDEITDEGLRETLGVIGLEVVDSFFDAVTAGDAVAAVKLVDDLAKGGHDLGHFCRELVERARELLLLRSSSEAAAVLDLSEAEAAEARKRAEAFSVEDLLRISAALTDLEARLRWSPHPRFSLEMAAIQLTQVGRLEPIGELVARMEALAGGATPTPRTGGSSGSAPAGGGSRPATAGPKSAPQSSVKPSAPAAEKAAGPQPAAAAAPPEVVPADSKEEEIRRRISSKRSALASYLEHAGVMRLEGERLVIRFPTRFALFKNGLARSDNRQIVEQAAEEATGHKVTLDVGISDETDPGMETITQEENRKTRHDVLMSRAMEEPAVRSFMETFRGTVVRIEENDNP
ncbi:MAG: DNA polymerase III subunit gamma/tau [Acidobacteria bacterium]|nr:MAG: DNA polymerase III subunit gamma/tau [Acidobacteriota bacterium]